VLAKGKKVGSERETSIQGQGKKH